MTSLTAKDPTTTSAQDPCVDLQTLSRRATLGTVGPRVDDRTDACFSRRIMFRLHPLACGLLSPEAQMVAEIFLSAMPPFAGNQIRSVRLFGPQAQRYDPESPFDVLVLAEARSIDVKTAIAIATSAVEVEAQVAVCVTLVTAFESKTSTGALGRTLQNARREGVDLWTRDGTPPVEQSTSPRLDSEPTGRRALSTMDPHADQSKHLLRIPSNSLSIASGDVLDQYVVDGFLGRGGMSSVYRVNHRHLGSVHALKILLPDFAGDAELRQRFLVEGQIQANLRHPNIVRVTDVVTLPGIAGLVLEYVDGESLDKYLRRRHTHPSATDIRGIFVGILDGVGFAHSRGIVHRDIKPANILVERAGTVSPLARIMDFGIAKVMARNGSSGATRTGRSMGTLHYMSREQIRGAKNVTVQSDIFSLGVTLYEFATGELPFAGDSDFDVQLAIVQGQFKPVDAVRPGLEPRIARAIERAMQPDPAARFASCQEFAAALG